MNTKYRFLTTALILIQLSLSFAAAPPQKAWLHLKPGLALATFDAPQKSYIGDSRITVLRIDPHYYDAEILTASQHGKKRRTISKWAEEFELTAAINAGMYATDNLTSVGYLKSGRHLNNARLNNAYNCVFACGPLEKDIPPLQIIDRRCQDFAFWKDKYRSFSQSIRMISCRQQNMWQQQPKKWSIAALAMDKAGNLLFIHCRSPYSVHDFINMLLELPLNIYNAMYLEGGPEASMYVSAGGIEKLLVGSYETGFLLNDGNVNPWPIPNIIGIRRKSSQQSGEAQKPPQE